MAGERKGQARRTEVKQRGEMREEMGRRGMRGESGGGEGREGEGITKRSGWRRGGKREESCRSYLTSLCQLSFKYRQEYKQFNKPQIEYKS